MKKETIYKNIKQTTNTIYGRGWYYEFEDGFKITSIYSNPENFSEKEIKDNLVENVLEEYERRKGI
jgi:hypothetical protein